MNLNLTVTSKCWSLQPQFSTTNYDPFMMKTWRKTMEDILMLLQQQQPILMIAPNPLESLDDVFSSNSQSITYNNVVYSIMHLQPTNVEYNKGLLTIALNSMEFECAGLWFVVLQDDERQSTSTDFIMKILKTIEESNHFLTLEGIEVELLACVADGKELLWLNPQNKSEVFLDKIIKMLETQKWQVTVIEQHI